jgi:alpha-tubulin suppressor-like RCC1 family protein
MNMRIAAALAALSGLAVLVPYATDTGVTPVYAGTYSVVDAGNIHTCAISTSGGLHCWGRNDEGQIGDGTTTQRLWPAAVSGLTSGVTSVGAGGRHSCAVTGGNVKCWGENLYGQLGDGTTTNRLKPVTVCASGSGGGCTALSGVSIVDSGDYHNCVLTTAGGVKCWGKNNYGQLGNGTQTNSSNPVDVTGLTSGVTAIAVGLEHSCALLGTGGVKCWGSGYRGKLGDGTWTMRTTPVQVSGLTSGVASIAAGEQHTCAVLTSGAMKCWGGNHAGQVGTGTVTPSVNTPVNVCASGSGGSCPALTGVASATAGGGHTCARMTSGAMKCWGWDGFGQIGDGGSISITENKVLPTDVQGLTGTPAVTKVSAGAGHTCAVTSANVLKCWGWGGFGQLGNGRILNVSTAQDNDFDSDGCQDERELGTNETTGGKRNPKNFWDFFDVWTGTPYVRDRIVNSTDVSAVQARYFTNGDPNADPLATPSASNNYHPAFDRTDDPNSSEPWDLLKGDGLIRIQDIQYVSAQTGPTPHNCQ